MGVARVTRPLIFFTNNIFGMGENRHFKFGLELDIDEQ